MAAWYMPWCVQCQALHMQWELWVDTWVDQESSIGRQSSGFLGKFELKGYVDADLAGDIDSRNSTIGFVLTLGGTVIFWFSNLQKIVALSTTEAEYVAATKARQEMIWLHNFLDELGKKQELGILHHDGQSAIFLANNLVFRSKLMLGLMPLNPIVWCYVCFYVWHYVWLNVMINKVSLLLSKIMVTWIFGYYHIVHEMHSMWFMWFSHRRYRSQVLCKLIILVRS